MSDDQSVPTISPAMLGDPTFLRDHRVRHAYVAGAMVKGIASEAMVVRMANAGLLSFFGSGGLRAHDVAEAIDRIQRQLPSGAPFGVNFLHNMLAPAEEDRLVDVLLDHHVPAVEASAFIHVTPALVRYRLTGLRRGAEGQPEPRHRLMAKVSRLEVASQFLRPPDPRIVADLRAAGRITAEEAHLAARIPLADDVCAEADSGGHTDRRPASTLIPAILHLRDELTPQLGGPRVRVGAAGGLGTPAAIAAAFILGADFVLTGSINQCTPEAGTSDIVKDLLAQATIHDMEMAPAGDMFEIGAKVQVLKRGVLFPARANRLYEVYRRHDGIDQIDPALRGEIEDKYFGRSFDEVWEETRRYYAGVAPQECDAAERNPKKKMAMIFRWYFVHSNRLAIEGRQDQRADFQIHCGPAMGALNQWLRGTPLADWRRRHVDVLADALMRGAADHLAAAFAALRRRRSEER